MKTTLVVCLLLAGCAAQELPPVPPMPEDLSSWSLPVWEEEEPPVVSVAPVVPPQKRANARVYPYEPGREYLIPVGLGYPADVLMEPGETVQTIVGGDRQPLQEGETPRWEVKEGKEGDSQTHLFFTPSHVKQRLGVVVTTNRRAYYLTLTSVQSTPIRTVYWTYPFSAAPVVAKRATILPDGKKSQRYHVGYIIEPPDPAPDWTPRVVVDDGKKTYLIFSPTMLYQVAPLVRLIGPQGPQLVNSRQVGRVIMIDQLIERVELRAGAGEQAQVVTIRRGALQTIACPGHEQCPSWPMEPQYAGGTP